MTNREVAAASFVSPKTVEANLARVYQKLGIRSRAELGARLAATPGTPGPKRRESPDVSGDGRCPSVVSSRALQLRRHPPVGAEPDTLDLKGGDRDASHPGPCRSDTHQERYEEAVGGHRQAPLQSPADWPVEGLLVHAAGQGKDGFRVVDLWESEEAAGRFGAIMVPILQEIGVTDMPEIYPAHTFVSALVAATSAESVRLSRWPTDRGPDRPI